MSDEDERHQDDLRIAREIIARNEAVAREFFAASHPKLLGYVLSRCGDLEEAEEVTQETWEAAIKGLDRFAGQASLLTWMCSIARFKLAARRRGQGRAGRQARIEAFESALEDPGADIFEHLEHQEVRQVLAATLALLPDDQRRALEMRYLDDRSVREIGLELGRSEKAAESLLWRARISFRELWDREGGSA